MKLSRLRLDAENERPIIPVWGSVVFPYANSPVFVDKNDDFFALNPAVDEGGELLFLYLESQSSSENHGRKKFSLGDFQPIGTVGEIVQKLTFPDGSQRIIVKGLYRVYLKKILVRKNVPWGKFTRIQEPCTDGLETLIRSIKEELKLYTKICKKRIPRKTLSRIQETSSPEQLIGYICDLLELHTGSVLPLFLETDNRKRLEELAVILKIEIESVKIKDDISTRVKKRMENSQREYILNEQIKEIHKELGADESDPTGAHELKQKLEGLGLDDEIKKKMQDEIKRLARIPSISPESGVLRSYLEWIVDLPWAKRTQKPQSIAEAESILNADHYGLEKPKERILDFIAVSGMHTKRVKSPILCFVGPPGTGKTSLGRSVARALGRKFVRISLGGVRDEAEIRGHRKTYVGALPGKIIQGVKRASVINPVFLLDEIDKMSHDFRGDPASALLEVLDPEQNNSFTDHYLEVPFDLSEIIFITTANSLENIPHPLRDRMEVIRTPGYTVLEKKNIAKKFLIPKQIAENGLEDAEVRFSEEDLGFLIRGYTLEAGVRNLERCIAQILRKLARKLLHEENSRPGRWIVNSASLHLNQKHWELCQTPENNLPRLKDRHFEIDSSMIRIFLGNERLEDHIGTIDRPGLALGLYYDGGGGGVLPVEVLVFDGEEKLILTGQLGNVMKESAQIALSYLRANREHLGLKAGFAQKKNIHIHVPQGAIPVDGPSAGIALTAAILSAVLETPIRSGIAVTGEVTLTDKILPIGGVKEKTLAARRRNLSTIIMPKDNKRDVDELPAEVKEHLSIIFHERLSEALADMFPEGTFPSF